MARRRQNAHGRHGMGRDRRVPCTRETSTSRLPRKINWDGGGPPFPARHHVQGGRPLPTPLHPQQSPENTLHDRTHAGIPPSARIRQPLNRRLRSPGLHMCGSNFKPDATPALHDIHPAPCAAVPVYFKQMQALREPHETCRPILWAHKGASPRTDQNTSKLMRSINASYVSTFPRLN